MKKSAFTALVFTALVFASCGSTDAGSASSAPASTASASTASASNNDASAEKAVFSYNLDGEKVSGGEVDATATNNAAHMDQSGDVGKRLQFFLSDGENDKTDLFAHSMRFTIPGKTGPEDLTLDEEHWNVELFVAPAGKEPYVIYQNESFHVVVNNVSATRVSGTFSGKFKLAQTQPDAKPEVIVTDGQFDLPLSGK